MSYFISIKIEISSPGGDSEEKFGELFGICGSIGTLDGGFNVNVNVTDTNDIWTTEKTHMDSALQTLKKRLSALLDMIVAALKVIAKVARYLVKDNDLLDSDPFNPFKDIEEIISITSFSYAITCLGDFYLI